VGDLVRFGVSIESELLASYDQMITERGYANRSEALRDLIRDRLVNARLESFPATTQVLGTLTLVYDHHASDLTERMASLQHDHHELVISVVHTHVSHDDCLEVILLRGVYGEINILANSLLSLKGIKHGHLFVTLPATDIEQHPKAEKEHEHKHEHKHVHKKAKS
jgi:CopG family transcriptional regulator, nickel-responsive regulator